MDDDGWYYPNAQIIFDGDLVEEVFAILETANYEIPATAGDWGYECYSEDFAVEADVEYDSSYDFTFVTFYSTADF